jgi:hypothetical protein
MKFIDDILILGGLGVVIAATFILSTIAGLYALGATLFLLGVYFARR